MTDIRKTATKQKIEFTKKISEVISRLVLKTIRNIFLTLLKPDLNTYKLEVESWFTYRLRHIIVFLTYHIL